MKYKPILLTCAALLAGVPAPAQRVEQSNAAARVLNMTDRARKAIEKKDKNQALIDVEAATEDANKVQARVVPLYVEMEEATLLEPIAAEKNRRSAGAPVTRLDRYTTVSVDMEMAKDRLKAARVALLNVKLEDADQALADLQYGVVLEAVATEAPLLKARQDLYAAKAVARQNRMGDATALLHAASSDLKQYSTTPSAPYADKAKALQQEIESSIQTLGRDPAAAEKIDRWWNQIVELSEPHQ
jgi:hypothetical protein